MLCAFWASWLRVSPPKTARFVMMSEHSEHDECVYMCGMVKRARTHTHIHTKASQIYTLNAYNAIEGRAKWEPRSYNICNLCVIIGRRTRAGVKGH